jgi:uncharacterized phage protein (TIGR01671 family)
MREIKFRVWDEEDQKMYYDMCFIPDWGFIKNGYEDCPWTDTFESRIVMQYTGVKDANAKEIYEDDILQWDDEDEVTQVIVEWSQGGFIFLIINDPYNLWKETDMSYVDEYKIIGNKHENPELLEKINGMDECNSNDM